MLEILNGFDRYDCGVPIILAARVHLTGKFMNYLVPAPPLQLLSRTPFFRFHQLKMNLTKPQGRRALSKYRAIRNPYIGADRPSVNKISDNHGRMGHCP